MPDLFFPSYALAALADDDLTEDDACRVVEDADDALVRTDGRTEYSRTLDDGRYVVVVVEDDGITVVTAWQNRRRSRRERRRR